MYNTNHKLIYAIKPRNPTVYTIYNYIVIHLIIKKLKLILVRPFQT